MKVVLGSEMFNGEQCILVPFMSTVTPSISSSDLRGRLYASDVRVKLKISPVPSILNDAKILFPINAINLDSVLFCSGKTILHLRIVL